MVDIIFLNCSPLQVTGTLKVLRFEGGKEVVSEKKDMMSIEMKHEP